jgi:cathepsin F
MKVLALFVVYLAVASCFSAKSLFNEWKALHNKKYVDVHEEARRFSVFNQNLAKIAALNTEEEAAKFVINKFADLTEQEFSDLYLQTKGFGNSFSKYPEAMTILPVAPDSYDWRTKGAVTPVKDQGQCGSCWAFSTTGNVEAVWFLKTGKLVSLSEQNLVDCDHECDPQSPSDCDEGCNGGLMWNAFVFIRKHGIDTEDSYRYTARDGTCKQDKGIFGANVTGWEKVSTDESLMAAYLTTHVPISIGINASPLQFYGSGILDPKSCNPKALDHGVLIVGYGHDTASGKDFWIVKNSWGKSWGEQGYFRIVRGKGACGLNTMACSSVA